MEVFMVSPVYGFGGGNGAIQDGAGGTSGIFDSNQGAQGAGGMGGYGDTYISPPDSEGPGFFASVLNFLEGSSQVLVSGLAKLFKSTPNSLAVASMGCGAPSRGVGVPASTPPTTPKADSNPEEKVFISTAEIKDPRVNAESSTPTLHAESSTPTLHAESSSPTLHAESSRPVITAKSERLRISASRSSITVSARLIPPEYRFEKIGVPIKHAYDFTNQLEKGAKVVSICVDRYRLFDDPKIDYVDTLERTCLPNHVKKIPASLLKIEGNYILGVRQELPGGDPRNFVIYFKVVGPDSK